MAPPGVSILEATGVELPLHIHVFGFFSHAKFSLVCFLDLTTHRPCVYGEHVKLQPSASIDLLLAEILVMEF